MVRWIVVIALAGSIIGGSGIAEAHQRHDVGHAGKGPCAIAWNIRPHASHNEAIKFKVRQLIRCAAERYNVTLSTALRVAECESGYYPWAVSPTGQYLGVYQVSTYVYYAGRTPQWNQWFPATGDPGRFNARANIMSALRYVQMHGWGAWACA